MKLEHFWYGLTDGDGYVFKRSSKIPSLLKETSLTYLKQLPARKTQVYTWLPAEQIVAVSQTETAADSTGRKGVKNYTILIPIKQYIALTFVFTPKFEVPSENVLEPLEVNP